MKFLRALLGGLVWIVAGVVGLLGVILSVTVILLPLGIPLLMLARRLFSAATALVLPRKVRHPAQEAKKSMRKKGGDLTSAAPDVDTKKATKKMRKAAAAVAPSASDAGKKTRKFLKRQRKRVA